MRTNVVLNEELMQEAARYSNAKSKSALLEEALRTLVQVRARERATQDYASRLRRVQQKLQNKVFRESSTQILHRDRNRL